MLNDIWYRLKYNINSIFLSEKENIFLRYGIPLFFVIIILFIKFILHLTLSEITSFQLLLLPVILSAWYGGFGPGIFVTILIGVLNDYLFLAPSFSLLSSEGYIILSVFFIEGLLVSVISESLRHSIKQKDQFISFASHELKNPLAVIKGYSQLIEVKAKKNKDKFIADKAQKITTYVNQSAQLINEFLDVTRIEIGKLALRKELFDICVLIQSIVKDQQILSKSHKIIFENKVKNRKIIYGDTYRISQIIINLISNAIKYSPGARKISIKLTRSEKNSVLIVVRDFGIGMAKVDQQRVFDRYYRTKKTQGIKGLGLGLYISRQLAKLHNGSLWAESKDEAGSAFYLKLPSADPKSRSLR